MITFITKTIPNWIKSQAERIANLFKKRKNPKVIDTSELSAEQEKTIEELAKLSNTMARLRRREESIENSMDSDPQLNEINNIKNPNNSNIDERRKKIEEKKKTINTHIKETEKGLEKIKNSIRYKQDADMAKMYKEIEDAANNGQDVVIKKSINRIYYKYKGMFYNKKSYSHNVLPVFMATSIAVSTRLSAVMTTIKNLKANPDMDEKTTCSPDLTILRL